MIPKLGHTPYVLAKSFHPISLTSLLLKTVKRLMDRYVRYGALVEYPLHSHQHAYHNTTLPGLYRQLSSLLYKTESALMDEHQSGSFSGHQGCI
jgi:hypothetical protein